jgi:hypothetical protein
MQTGKHSMICMYVSMRENALICMSMEVCDTSRRAHLGSDKVRHVRVGVVQT